MACNLAVHRPHYVAEGSGCNFVKQAQHQTLLCGVPLFHLARHASADICHPRDSKPLSSQVCASCSYDKASLQWHKILSPDASAHSRFLEEFEVFQNPACGMIKLSPIGNPNSTKVNNFPAQSKLNLCIQFTNTGQEHKQDEKESIRADESTSPSSSIGQLSEDSSCGITFDKPSEEMEVQSSLRNPLDHMGCLETSLPIKRGLSKFFSGKSRSFRSLSDVSSIKDLAKAEDPYAKKRKRHGSVNLNLSGDASLGNTITAIGSKKPFSTAKSNISFAIAGCESGHDPAVKHP